MIAYLLLHFRFYQLWSVGISSGLLPITGQNRCLFIPILVDIQCRYYWHKILTILWTIIWNVVKGFYCHYLLLRSIREGWTSDIRCISYIELCDLTDFKMHNIHTFRCVYTSSWDGNQGICCCLSERQNVAFSITSTSNTVLLSFMIWMDWKLKVIIHIYALFAFCFQEGHSPPVKEMLTLHFTFLYIIHFN